MSIMRTAPTGERHVEQEARLDGSDLTTGALDRMVRGGGLRTRWRRRLQPFLLASDVGVITLGLVAFSIGSFPETLAVYVGALLTLSALGAYRSRLTLSVLDDMPALVSAALVGAVAELVLRTVVGSGSGGSSEPTLLRHALAVAVLLVVSRAVAYLLVREARRRGLIRHRTLILGSGAIGRQIAEATLEHPECGLRLVGFLDSAPQADQADLPVPLLGGYDDLATCIRREGVSEVIVAFGLNDNDDSAAGAPQDATLVDAVRACDRMDTEIFCVPRFFELHHRSRDMDELWGISLVRVRRATWRSRSWQVKRAFDVLLSAIALVALSPLLLAVALAVRIENGPGVLFRQVRVGLDGEPFTLLKFRSLRLPETRDDGAAAGPVWSINGDARLGPVGRIIRKTSIDELPQLINILRGDMTIVGPRPERPEFVEQFTRAIPRYTARHRTPAGLTGWAQVNGLRGDTSIEERARFDNYYIQNWSLWLDVKIVARTVSSVLLRRGS